LRRLAKEHLLHLSTSTAILAIIASSFEEFNFQRKLYQSIFRTSTYLSPPEKSPIF
jgi:hypothetical protein